MQRRTSAIRISACTATTLFVYGVLGTTTAMADCTPDPVAAGGTVTCSGVDANGFASASDNLSITVNAGATVNEGAGSAFDLDGAGVLLRNNGTVSTSTAGLGGINFNGPSGTIELGNGASIVTTGNNLGSYGIRVAADGTSIDMASNSSITTAAAVGIALQADDIQIDIASSVSILTNGRFGHSILALNQGDITVNVAAGATLTTLGNDARGIDLQSSNATINLSGAVMTTGGQEPSGSGDGAIGLIVGDSNFGTTGGTINISSTGSVATAGDGAFGVLADGANTLITIASGATVTATGGAGAADGFPAGGVGTAATNGIVNNAGTISANPATLSLAVGIFGDDTVFNNQGSGVINGGFAAIAYLSRPGVSTTFNNANIVSGAIIDFEGSNQVLSNTGTINAAFNGGQIDLAGGDDQISNSGVLAGVIALGDGSDTISIAAGSTISGVPLMDGGDDTEAADTYIDTLSFVAYTGVVNDLSNWEAINVNGGAALLLAGTAYTAGLTSINAGSTIDMGAGNRALNSALNINSGTLDVTGGGAGVYAIAGNTNNAALITAADGQAGDVLTVGGNYTGSGVLTLDTVLNDGSSSMTDSLTVNGSSSGTTTLQITNIGGPGGLTGSGPTDGIRVVTVLGSSSPNAFSISAPLVAGGFAYSLVQADGQNWYLQSVVAPPGGGGGAVGIPTMNQWTILATMVALLLIVQVATRSQRRQRQCP